MEKKDIEVIIPEGLEEYKYVNAYSLGHSETEIVLEFGRGKKSDKDETRTVEVVSRLTLPPKLLIKLILDLFKLGQDYEKEYDCSIGFSIKKHNNKEESEVSRDE